MEMSEAVWNHITEWIEMYKEQFGKLPESGQIVSFIHLMEWDSRPNWDSKPSEAIEDEDDESDEDS